MFVVKSTPRQPTSTSGGNDIVDPHECFLSMYSDPPFIGPDGEDSISINEFRQFAVDRLVVLQAIDKACKLDSFIPESASVPLETLLKERGLALRPKDVVKNAVLKDELSHFILRLAFCRQQEKRDWFMKQELRLFRFRLQKSGAAGRERLCDFPVVKDLTEVPESVRLYVGQSQKSANQDGIDAQKIFRMPFEKAYSLVAHRRVAVWKGEAYVLGKDLDSTFAADLREVIRSSLEHISESSLALTGVFEDLRMGEFLKLIGDMYLGQASEADLKAAGKMDRLTKANLEVMSKRSFPPCARWMTEHLKSFGKHMHTGRLQLRLFYKGCGMTMDEQIAVWSEWQHKVNADEFRKNHLYNIRHAYGQEGKRADYSPWPCLKVISTHNPVQAGECHGCPFKVLDELKLRNLLSGWGVNQPKVLNEIANLKKNHHLQLACVEVFKALHPGSEGEGVGNHPNDYYRESSNWYKIKEGKADEDTESEEGASQEAGGSAPPAADVEMTAA